MTSQSDCEREQPAMPEGPDAAASKRRRDRRAPKIAVGDASAVQDRKADSTSMRQVRTTFIFLAFIGIAYAAYLVMSARTKSSSCPLMTR